MDNKKILTIGEKPETDQEQLGRIARDQCCTEPKEADSKR